MENKNNWRRSILPASATIEQAIENLNRVSIKIVLIENSSGKLEGTISDGDIRRGLLHGLGLKDSIVNIIHRHPLVVPPELSRELVLQLMSSNKVHQIPIVDDDHHVVGLHLWDEISVVSKRENIVVIMAGGMGTRLHPITENCPKPLLNVGGKPMLQHIIDRAKKEGFYKFIIAIRHLGHMIESHFGDGKHMDINIEYLHEKDPLGTAGALSLLKPHFTDLPFIVTNGDVITDIHYAALLDFHIRHRGIATMAVRLHEWQNPFGVVQTKGVEIIHIEEKPINRSQINAGIYALNPEVLNILNIEERCDMTTLFTKLKQNKKLINAYPMHEPWLDVGRPDDLFAANKL